MSPAAFKATAGLDFDPDTGKPSLDACVLNEEGFFSWEVGALYDGGVEGDLYRSWKRLRKKYGWDDRAGTAAGLRAAMVRYAPVPRCMAEEMADFFLPPALDEQAVYKSDEVLELLAGRGSSQNSILSDDDWVFLEEQVNEWAHELDMRIVTHVMRAVVERGRFS